jgi:hypothetical protein
VCAWLALGLNHCSSVLCCRTKPSLWFGPQVNYPPGLACGSLNFARLGDQNLNTQSNRTAYVRREQLAQRAACNLIGMARPCFGQDTHGVETFVAPQLDDEMRGSSDRPVTFSIRRIDRARPGINRVRSRVR